MHLKIMYVKRQLPSQTGDSPPSINVFKYSNASNDSTLVWKIVHKRRLFFGLFTY